MRARASSTALAAARRRAPSAHAVASPAASSRVSRPCGPRASARTLVTSRLSSLPKWCSASPAAAGPSARARSFGSSAEDDDHISPTSRPATPPSVGIAFVPQQTLYVLERFGKFHRVLEPGANFYVPIVDRVAYAHSLKEEAIRIPRQFAITRDNVTLSLDGVLYVRVADAYKASYGVSDAFYAITQLAQTTMRSELGKLTLDQTFEEREALNHNIVSALNEAGSDWGVECLRYEIRDIRPPESIRAAMDKQAGAERRKRATILDSEGEQQAQVNQATGGKTSVELRAEGEADAIIARAEATAEAILALSKSLDVKDGARAAALRVAEAYVTAFRGLAKPDTTMLIPHATQEAGAMARDALAIFEQAVGVPPEASSGSSSSSGGGGGPATPPASSGSSGARNRFTASQSRVAPQVGASDEAGAAVERLDFDEIDAQYFGASAGAGSAGPRGPSS